MYSPTTRLLTILELLQTYERLSSTELATRLEVDARTVRRYIVMLQDMGIPVEGEMGREGGYSLRPGFNLPPMMFTNEEMVALVVGLRVVRHLGLNAASCAVEGAMAKLQRVLPETLRQQAESIQNALVFDLPVSQPQVQEAVFARLGQAIHETRQAWIVYKTDHEETTRTVDPYGLVCHEGQWYLVGYCHLRTDRRVFRLDRIADVELQREMFIPPADFDSLDFLFQSIAAIPDRWNIEVLLKTTLEQAAEGIPPGLGTLAQHPNGILFRAAVGDIDWMARFLAGLGCPLVVHQPPELKTAFERLAAAILHFARSDIDD
jgi:predicted DNA-binding transcriptional regulator YafY